MPIFLTNVKLSVLSYFILRKNICEISLFQNFRGPLFFTGQPYKYYFVGPFSKHHNLNKRHCTQQDFIIFLISYYCTRYRQCNNRTYDNHVTSRLAYCKFNQLDQKIFGIILSFFGTVFCFPTPILFFHSTNSTVNLKFFGTKLIFCGTKFTILAVNLILLAIK